MRTADSTPGHPFGNRRIAETATAFSRADTAHGNSQWTWSFQVDLLEELEHAAQIMELMFEPVI